MVINHYHVFLSIKDLPRRFKKKKFLVILIFCFALEENQFQNLNKHFMYKNDENIMINNYIGNHLFS